MDSNKPRFELTRIYSDGSAEEPQIMPINEVPWEMKTNRKGFLGTGLVAVGALAVLAKCKKDDLKPNTREYTGYSTYLRRTVTGSVPCDEPLPPLLRLTCTCDCVYRPTTSGGGGGGGSYCTCNLVGTCACNSVCTCVPICQAHKLLHRDKFVKMLAREILFFMGIEELEYLDWAANNSKARLQKAIKFLIKELKDGVQADYRNWPTIAKCKRYLHHKDEVVSVMAAQMINLQISLGGQPVSKELNQKVELLLARSEEMHWKKRLAG